MLLTISH